MSKQESERFDVYAVIELLGHRRLIGRVMTQDKSIWLGTRIGQWFWFNGDSSHWFTQGCMVRYRGQWCVAQSLTSQRVPRPRRVRWWGRLGRIGRCHRY